LIVVDYKKKMQIDKTHIISFAAGAAIASALLYLFQQQKNTPKVIKNAQINKDSA